MTGKFVSCAPPDSRYPGDGARWRCACGVIWRYYVGLSGSGWKPDGWRVTKRRAVRQHMRWIDEQRRSEALRAALSPADRAWLDSLPTVPNVREADSS